MNKNNLFKIFNNCAINKDQANKNILKNSSFESSFNSVPCLHPLSLLCNSNSASSYRKKEAKEGCLSPKIAKLRLASKEKNLSTNLPSILLQSQPLPCSVSNKPGEALQQRGEDNKNINNPKFSSILRAIRTICLSRDELKIFRLINLMERKKSNRIFSSSPCFANSFSKKANIGVPSDTNNINRVVAWATIRNGMTGVNGVDIDINSTFIGSIISELKEISCPSSCLRSEGNKKESGLLKQGANANNVQLLRQRSTDILEAPECSSSAEAGSFYPKGGKIVNSKNKNCISAAAATNKLAKKLELEQIKKQEAELQTKFFSLKQNIKLISYNNIISNNILLRNRPKLINLDLKSTLSNLLKKRIKTISEVLEDKPIKNYVLFKYLKNFIFAKTKLSLNKYSPGLLKQGRKFGNFIHYNKIIGYKFNSNLFATQTLQALDKEKLYKFNMLAQEGYCPPKGGAEGITDIYKLLFYFFKSMYCLISKPVLKYTNDKVTIQLFYYLNIPKKKVFRLFSILYINSIKKKWLLRLALAKKRTTNRFGSQANLVSRLPKLYIRWKLRKAISRLRKKNKIILSKAIALNPGAGFFLDRKNLLFKLRKFNLSKVFQNKFKLICNILSKKFNKPVELQLIRLHHPYHDSNILVNLLSLNIKNKRKKARVAVQKIYNKKPVKNLNDPNLNSVKFIPAFLSGLNIKIAGRLMGEPIIPRITTKVFGKGASATGKVNYLDVARITKKNRKGAYTIKITSGQNFF